MKERQQKLKHAPVPAKRNDRGLRDKESARVRKKLGLDINSLRNIPVISPLLARIEGGRDGAIEILRLSDQDEAHTFLDAHDAISKSDRGRLTIEELCVVAKVETKKFLSMVVETMVEHSRNASAIVAAAAQPRVVERLSVFAQDPVMIDDRKMFLAATGFLPTPAKSHGGNVFVNVSQQNANLPGNDPDALPGGDVPQLTDGRPENRRFTTAEDELKRFHESVDGSKLLKEPQQVVQASSQTVVGHAYEDTVGDRQPVQELDCIPTPP